MVNSRDLGRVSIEKIVDWELENISSKIEEENKDGERKVFYFVERNGWFDLSYCIDGEIGKISWGNIIYDIMDKLESNGFKVRLYNSYGSVSYTKILEISW